jgi:hypothetical protein
VRAVPSHPRDAEGDEAPRPREETPRSH